MKPENVSNKIARIENKFIFHAQYKFTSREQKVILYLIANINPKQERFIEQIIPVRELEQVLKSDGKKWGGLMILVTCCRVMASPWRKLVS